MTEKRKPKRFDSRFIGIKEELNRFNVDTTTETELSLTFNPAKCAKCPSHRKQACIDGEITPCQQ